MTYDILLENVKHAQKQKEHKAYPAPEQQLVSYLLSQIREGIQQDRFRTARKYSHEVQLAEIQFSYNYICIFVNHRYSSLVKVIKHAPGAAVNVTQIVGAIKKLGLEAEVMKNGHHIDKVLVKLMLQTGK